MDGKSTTDSKGTCACSTESEGENEVITLPTKSAVKKKSLSESKKRLRSTFSKKQVTQLEVYFATNPYPDKLMRDDIAIELGLTVKQVHIWFQNRRAKKRKKESNYPVPQCAYQNIHNAQPGHSDLFLPSLQTSQLHNGGNQTLLPIVPSQPLVTTCQLPISSQFNQFSQVPVIPGEFPITNQLSVTSGSQLQPLYSQFNQALITPGSTIFNDQLPTLPPVTTNLFNEPLTSSLSVTSQFNDFNLPHDQSFPVTTGQLPPTIVHHPFITSAMTLPISNY